MAVGERHHSGITGHCLEFNIMSRLLPKTLIDTSLYLNTAFLQSKQSLLYFTSLFAMTSDHEVLVFHYA